MLNRTLSLALFAIVSLSSCHKDTHSPVPPPQQLGTMNINLTYPRTYAPMNYYELVFSEPGGKVLLDTVVQFNTTVSAGLKTNSAVVDMVIIDTSSQVRTITAYKSVNPSTWTNELPGSYVTRYRSSLPGSTIASVEYNHVPPFSTTNALDSFFLNNGPVSFSSSETYNPATNILDVTFWRYPGCYNFLSFPKLGLYKLYKPQMTDTFDLTHMDTLIAVTFPRPSTFYTSYFGTSFLGITDSTNRSLDVSFMDGVVEHPVANVDLQYPRQPMQLYELDYLAFNTNNEGLGFYSYGKTVPTSWNFIDGSKFTVSGTQIDNLSIKNTAAATIANSFWKITNNSASLNLYWNPDSSSIHPLTWLTGLKAKFLSGVSLSDLKCSTYSYEQMPGFSYNSYFTYATDPAKMATHQISISNHYSKYL